jgi:electron transfer flavoprotein alpha subunit
MAVIIIAEHDNENLNPNTRSLVTAANKINSEVVIAVIGSGSSLQNVADQAAKISNVSKVKLLNSDIFENRLAENLVNAVEKISEGFSHILAPATTFGKNFLPRLAARLDIQQISEVIEVIDPATFKRPIYAGNAIATVKSFEDRQILTVRPSTFDKADESGSADIEQINIDVEKSELAEYVGLKTTESDRPDLTTADRVISGGRGLGSGENFALIEKVADKLGAAIGASRAAVDAGYVPNDYQVGQTGKIIAPELYIAVGISGAIQHLAGMKDSKVIVAINKDENAPIFEVADFGLVADLFDVLPELEQKL